ncbi:MAG: hypothetical protein RBR01_01720 [Desulfobacterales bacterium]|nr:hypothetical protein [Desulfobacterales bacterium]MDD3080761.1 hypothetical protein [Desulfobacterales bacterium]MDY0377130.1 hypothetical protein [Desulfobacterales bacterium]
MPLFFFQSCYAPDVRRWPSADCFRTSRRAGRRTLAIDAAGKVFAAWEDSEHRIVGRWILRNE